MKTVTVDGNCDMTLIGEGGFGAVSRAQKERDNSSVAIKICSKARSDAGSKRLRYSHLAKVHRI